MLLYPNPTQGSISITFPEDINEKTLVSIYALEGKKIFEMSIHPDLLPNRQHSLHTEHYPTGMYFVKLMSNSFVVTHKFLKE